MPRISIIMRSKNDEKVIGATLAMVAEQTIRDWELVNIDSGSTDQTLDIIRRYNPRPLRIRPEQYVPGWVLNEATRSARGETLVYLNSDCTPTDERWLERLVAPLALDAAAVYSRQVARPEADVLVRRDYEVAYPTDGGDTREAVLGDDSWRSFFSMASSATTREVWQRFPFDDHIRYSEDILWARALREAGLRVMYVPGSAVYHSHNYTLVQAFRRFRGEGAADARIFPHKPLRESLPFYVGLPLLSAVARDTSYCIRHGELAALAHSVPLRVAQKVGRYVGLRSGRKELGR